MSDIVFECTPTCERRAIFAELQRKKARSNPGFREPITRHHSVVVTAAAAVFFSAVPLTNVNHGAALGAARVASRISKKADCS